MAKNAVNKFNKSQLNLRLVFVILIPVTLKKMNIDPAISSSVFVTTITDVIGFVSFLGVGAYFL